MTSSAIDEPEGPVDGGIAEAGTTDSDSGGPVQVPPHDAGPVDAAKLTPDAGSDAATCVALTGVEQPTQIVTIDLARRIIERGATLNHPLRTITSLGVWRGHLVACDEDPQYNDLHIINRATGEVESRLELCTGMTATREGLWMLVWPNTLTQYPDLDGLRGGVITRFFGAPSVTRIGPGAPGSLESAWETTNELVRMDIATEATTRQPIGLDGPVYGVSAVKGGLLAVSSPAGSGRGAIVVFDPSGKELFSVGSGETFFGLACDTD